MKIRISFLIMALCVSLSTPMSAQEISVSAHVSSEQIQAGRPFQYEITMKAPYGYFIDWAGYLADTMSSEVEVLNRNEVVRSTDADSSMIVSQTLSLITFDTGYVTIPEVGVPYAPSVKDDFRAVAYTAPISVYATKYEVDTAAGYIPIVAPKHQELRFRDIMPWLGIVLLVLVVVVAIYCFLKKKKTADGGEEHKVVVPPYEEAIARLHALRQEKLWQAGKVKDYYSSLSDIARAYISGQFGVPAVEMTTDEIMKALRPLRLDDSIYRKVKEVMERSDLVKFAKLGTSALENDAAMALMEDFVRESYAHYLEVEAKKAASQEQKSDNREVRKETRDV